MTLNFTGDILETKILGWNMPVVDFLHNFIFGNAEVSGISFDNESQSWLPLDVSDLRDRVVSNAAFDIGNDLFMNKNIMTPVVSKTKRKKELKSMVMLSFFLL